MNLRIVLVVLLMSLLSACVTTTTGRVITEADDAEAARLNRDLAINYMKQGKLEEALYKLQKSLKEAPDDPSTHRVMGYLYERLADEARAESSYRLAVKYGPEDQAALNQLAVFLCQQDGDRAEALEYFDRALVLPDYQDRHVIFANAGTCAKEVDLARAEGYLRKSIQLKPGFAPALYQMAEVAYRSGNFLQARAFLERCLAVSEPLPDTLWLGYRIESELGDAAAAQRFGDALAADFPASPQAGRLLEARRETG
ncbi:MAG: type IV pilus biogenesis/stability protein PilW [Gammaproteobacteria bacterium]|jgi:type IV pilus assembly protein PilF|nr:type IV pilus biogenesis/stability protein PilW [Gammaproteobacteria bacterium]